MIKITDEDSEAAARLLAKHNQAELVRAEARWQAKKNFVMGRTARREFWEDKDIRLRLEAIVNGTRKLIRDDWWIKVHGTVDSKLLAKIAALADPARNSSEHEREVAEAKLASAKARRPPGIPPPPPPLPDFTELVRRRKMKQRKKTKTPPSPQPSRRGLSDSVASPVKPAPVKGPSDSVARSNKQRAAKRAAARTGLTCQTCGKPLAAAQRATARYCSATCRSQAWRKIPQ